MTYQAFASIRLAEPRSVIAKVCAHLVEHDAQIETAGNTSVVRYRESAANIVCEEDVATIEVRSQDVEGLYFMRMALASHIQEFAIDGTPEVEWKGDGRDMVHPPNFRIIEVAAVRDVTPHMRRVTFKVPDLGRFVSLDALHANLIIPQPGDPRPQWPQVGPDGMIFWPDSERRPFRRKYTLRSVDVTSGLAEIDFVVHADAGPGSAFAVGAVPGDRIGMIGPGGGGLTQADWYLFVGDETALPAISRMVESLPASARGRAIIEVADEAEIQPLETAASIEIEWLCRSTGKSAGGLLPAEVEGVSFPADGASIFVWAGCEFDDFRAIRTFLRQKRGLKKQEHLVVSYWRRGQGEEQD